MRLKTYLVAALFLAPTIATAGTISGTITLADENVACEDITVEAFTSEMLDEAAETGGDSPYLVDATGSGGICTYSLSESTEGVSLPTGTYYMLFYDNSDNHQEVFYSDVPTQFVLDESADVANEVVVAATEIAETYVRDIDADLYLKSDKRYYPVWPEVKTVTYRYGNDDGDYEGSESKIIMSSEFYDYSSGYVTDASLVSFTGGGDDENCDAGVSSSWQFNYVAYRDKDGDGSFAADERGEVQDEKENFEAYCEMDTVLGHIGGDYTLRTVFEDSVTGFVTDVETSLLSIPSGKILEPASELKVDDNDDGTVTLSWTIPETMTDIDETRVYIKAYGDATPSFLKLKGLASDTTQVIIDAEMEKFLKIDGADRVEIEIRHMDNDGASEARYVYEEIFDDDDNENFEPYVFTFNYNNGDSDVSVMYAELDITEPGGIPDFAVAYDGEFFCSTDDGSASLNISSSSQLVWRDEDRDGVIDTENGDTFYSSGSISQIGECEIEEGPHAEGDYDFEVSYADGDTETFSYYAPAGDSAEDFPPVTNMQASIDSDRSIALSWDLPTEATYLEDDQIELRIYAYNGGASLGSKVRVRNLPSTLSTFTFGPEMTVLYDDSYADQVRIDVRVRRFDGYKMTTQARTSAYYNVEDSRETMTAVDRNDGSIFDVDGDNKTGIEEVIQTLDTLTNQSALPM